MKLITDFTSLNPSPAWTLHQPEPFTSLNPSPAWTLHQPEPFTSLRRWTLHQPEPFTSLNPSPARGPEPFTSLNPSWLWALYHSDEGPNLSQKLFTFRTYEWPKPHILYTYWQYTNLFIFRFVSLLCLRSTLRLVTYISIYNFRSSLPKLLLLSIVVHILLTQHTIFISLVTPYRAHEFGSKTATASGFRPSACCTEPAGEWLGTICPQPACRKLKRRNILLYQSVNSPCYLWWRTRWAMA